MSLIEDQTRRSALICRGTFLKFNLMGKIKEAYSAGPV